MNALTFDVKSEVAYDLMHDHLDTILALLESPLPRAEVIGRVGSEAVLDRMLRYGLLTSEGDALRAVADVYHQLRQEGMMSFLEHYVLPSLTAGVDGNGFASIETRHLNLDANAARALRETNVQELFNRLTVVSEEPAIGALARMTVMVIGTSNVLPEQLDDGDQALHHLKQAAKQRSTENERDLAVLSQYVFLADNKRYTAALGAVDEFLAQFESKRAGSVEATYHLTVATHWRSATPAATDGREQ
jgi:hypothetical protein